MSEPLEQRALAGSQAPGRRMMSLSLIVTALLMAGSAFGQGLEVLHAFVDTAPSTPDSLTVAADGTLVGTSANGGREGCGTIFTVLPTGQISVVHEFTVRDRRDDGFSFQSCAHRLVLAPDGSLYGIARETFLQTRPYSSSRWSGYLFRVTTAGAFEVLLEVAPNLTLRPAGLGLPFPVTPLVAVPDGSLYGLQASGVFKLTPGGTIVTLHTFQGAETSWQQDLVLGPDGNLYGSTSAGLYRLSPGGAYSLIYPASSGIVPVNLVTHVDGFLYGSQGNNVVRISTAGSVSTLFTTPRPTVSALFRATDGTFLVGSSGCDYGPPPHGETATVWVELRRHGPSGVDLTSTPLFGAGQVTGFVERPGGIVSFTTAAGRPFQASFINLGCYVPYAENARGTLVQLGVDGTIATETTLPTTIEPWSMPSGPVQASDGNLYGVSRHGGANDAGTIFRMTPSGAVTTLYSFVGGAGGRFPVSLKLGRNSQLIGSTSQGGVNDCGVLFRTSLTGSLTILYSLPCYGSGTQRGEVLNLVEALDGTLFGTTSYYVDGIYGYNGSVFRLGTDGVFTTLHISTSGAPRSLVLGTDGNLYGAKGGNIFETSQFTGGVFRLTPAGAYTDLLTGFGVYALVQGHDGFLYGARKSYPPLTSELFRVSTAGEASVLHFLPSVETGDTPRFVMETPGGDLIGTGMRSGSSYVYRYHSAGEFTVLRDGLSFPDAPLLLGADGLVYGIASNAEGQTFGFRMSTTVELGGLGLGAWSGGAPLVTLDGLPAGTPTSWVVSREQTNPPAEYRFWVWSDVGWRIVQEYSQDPVLQWTPARAGTYCVQVWARAVGSTAAWESYQSSGCFTVATPLPVTITSFTATPNLPATTGQSVTLSAMASGGVPPLQYQYYVREPGTGWRVLQSWGADPDVVWTPRSAGDYVVQVWVRSAGSAALYEDWRGTGIVTVSNGPLSVVSVDADRPLPVGVGGTVTWTPNVAGGDGTPLEYQYYRFDASRTQQWTLVRPYSESPSWTWTPAAGEYGRYWLQVWVRRQSSTAAYEAWAGTTAFEVTDSYWPLAVQLESSQGDPPNVPAGTLIEWRALATHAHGDLEYMVWRYDVLSRTWRVVQAYGPSDTYTWTPAPADAGMWFLQIWARRVGSTAAYEAWTGQVFTIQP